MARPEIIAALHAAWYDYRTAAPAGRAAARARFEELLRLVARQFDCTPLLLQESLREDFRVWCKQEGLPKPRPFSEDKP
jgi:hypothetical protein